MIAVDALAMTARGLAPLARPMLVPMLKILKMLPLVSVRYESRHLVRQAAH
jgi:hypothetical protein